MSDPTALYYLGLSRQQFGDLPGTYWHGAPDGRSDLDRAVRGIHIGTRQAATEALNARIGTPAEGHWDGGREYGKTPLGPGTRTGYSSREFSQQPDTETRLPSGRATYSSGTSVPMTARPDVFPVRITGQMTNTPQTPHEDFKANGYMAGAIKRGGARRGYFYSNVSEHEGSISAVVPGHGHLKTQDDYARDVFPVHTGMPFHDRRAVMP